MDVQPHTSRYLATLLNTRGRSLNQLPELRSKIPTYVWCSLFTALGGFLWGYDTGSIGPITVMPQFEAQFGALSPAAQGLLVSSILIAASITSVIAGPLSDRISRIRTISMGGAVYATGCAIACSAQHRPQLFIGRCIAGVGEGLFISSITVYVTEISPPASRGRLSTCVQLFNTCGVMSGYFTCYGTVKVPGSFSWRFPLALQAVVAVVVAVGTPFFPHSPRWLKLVNRHRDVDEAKRRLGVAGTNAEDNSVDTEIPNVRGNLGQDIKNLWRKDIRMRTLFCVFIMAIQQLSGIDAVLYYAPTLFSQAGLSSTASSFLASGVSGILMVVITFFCQWFQDKCSATAIICFIYIFIAGFISTWAIVCRIVCNEVQPTQTRAAASSLGQCANWVVNCVVAFSTPLFLNRSTWGPYFLFGGCSLLNAAVCFAFQPETKGLTLEAIDSGFEDTPFQSAMRRRIGNLRNRGNNTSGGGDESSSTAIELVEVSTK
ncbi:general substrate transporter [Desarmillaria tabescens]|uniref:General substrate transporter n=1 Tax=Armillaria tabescens TaxID=1929756 RepID=A0AA39KGL8_ARMTA|nr:general substrate transporter [Desarmillaria tabescens]KAK0458443.1 general substrate transporter [Desarmillaria tabescens]